jgi:transforming growth factor-beta-induced protein
MSTSRSIRTRAVALVAVLAVVGVACNDDLADTPAPTTVAGSATTVAAAATSTTLMPTKEYDIVGTALKANAFSQLAGMLLDAGLVDTMRGGPFTVFAPTDDAFKKLPLDVLHAVEDDPDMLATALTYHVVPGTLMAADLKDGPLMTVSGFELTVSHDGDTVLINGNPITTPDVVATNGVVHVMSDVLVPPCCGDIVGVATGLPGFGTLVDLVTAADLVDTLQSEGPFTVFAPTDAALAKIPGPIVDVIAGDKDLLTTVLTHHVVAGKMTTAELVAAGTVKTVAGDTLTITQDDAGNVYVDGNMIGQKNVQATNGIINVMSDPLVPALGDIIDVATTLPGFATLATLVTNAGLVDTLKGDGPFTVFAPVDAAFEALPAATLAAVQADPELLATVLTYHVVPGKLTTADLKPGKLTTVAGVDLTITVEDGVTLIDGHPIALQNVQASNGIIQVMGDVLVPET